MSQTVRSESDKYKKITCVHLLVRKYVDVNEHERLFHITLRHEFKKILRNSVFIVVLHFTVTVKSSVCECK